VDGLASGQLNPAPVPEAPYGLIQKDITNFSKRFYISPAALSLNPQQVIALCRLLSRWFGEVLFMRSSKRCGPSSPSRRPPQEQARSPLESLGFLLAVTVEEEEKGFITSDDWKGKHHSPRIPTLGVEWDDSRETLPNKAVTGEMTVGSNLEEESQLINPFWDTGREVGPQNSLPALSIKTAEERIWRKYRYSAYFPRCVPAVLLRPCGTVNLNPRSRPILLCSV
jgi:hypothetical protein